MYVKAGAVRNCQTRADVVAARFEGFVPAGNQDPVDVDYRDLQEQAKALGIPANQSKAALVKAVAAHPTETTTDPAGDQPGEDQETE